MVPRHHTCRRVSLLYTPRTLRSSSDGKNKTLFLVQDGNLRALVAGRSLLRLPLSGTTFLLTSDTAVLSHSSTLLSNLFSLLLPALNYSNPFTGIGYCTWFDLDFAADVITGWLIFLFFRFSFLGWGWEVERDCEREGKARGCQIVCMWVWGCVCVYAGEWEG